MSDQSDDNGDVEDLMPSVSEDRPLDSLVPEMRTLGGAGQGAPSEVPPVHPRVLEVGLEEGSEWTLAVWGDPGSGVADQIISLLRATLLMELSKPSTQELLARDFQAVRILVFAELAAETVEHLEHFGFQKVEYVADQYEERMAAWRKEAAEAGIELPGAPASVWRLGMARAGDETGDPRLVDGIARAMTDRLDGQPWGSAPGGMSRLLARRLEDERDIDIGLDTGELDRMVDLLVPNATGVIRWTPPVIFQALCDYVGVLAHGVYDRELQWGICEENDEGIVPPPTFRDPAGEGRSEMIPVGRAMLEWLILPQADGDSIAQIPLSRRVDSLLEVDSGLDES